MTSNRKPSAKKSLGFGTKSLIPELQRADALIHREKWFEARKVLEQLNQSYPNNIDVLSFLVNVCLDQHDSIGYTQACEQLLKADPKNADVAYGLAGGYMTMMHPLLALQAFEHALKRFPNHERAQECRTLVDQLENQMDQTLIELGLSGDQGKEIATLHELGQVYMERQDFQQARKMENEVLQMKPDFVSAQNNLSLISYVEGKVDEAISFSETVLASEPDNIHALSNLVRFLYLSGKVQAAEAYAERLKASQSEAWNRWTKKAEGLSYLGDDAGILALYKQAQAADDLKITEAMFFHLVAVAMQRTGDAKAAKALWETALTRSPYPLAQANLNDLRQPRGDRHGPWAFDLRTWFPPQEAEALMAIIQSSTTGKSDQTLKAKIEAYLKKYPNFVHIASILL